MWWVGRKHPIKLWCLATVVNIKASPINQSFAYKSEFKIEENLIQQAIFN